MAVSAAAVEGAAERILGRFRPDVLFVVNGLFAAERVFRQVADSRGIRAPTYEIAPRGSALVFSQGVPAPLYDTSAAWSVVRDRPLTDEQAAAIDRLLDDRARGVGAHERYFDETVDEAVTVRARLSIPPTSRVATLFTNLSWDSAVLHRDLAVRLDVLEWIDAAVDAAGRRPRADACDPDRPRRALVGDTAAGLGRPPSGSLPGNVRVVGPDDPISSYALLDVGDVVLTYASTIGLEAAVRGLPVAVAALTHYRECGFTIDVTSHSRSSSGRSTPRAHPTTTRWSSPVDTRSPSFSAA